MQRSALKRGKPLQRKARLRARGKSRFPKRRDPAYHAWVRTRPCIIARHDPLHVAYSGAWFAIDAAHVKSRGAGGDDRGNLVPLCHFHHMEQHDIGIRSFQARWGIDLQDAAARLYQTYVHETGG